MTYTVDIQNEAGYDVNVEQLQAAACTVLSAHETAPANSSLTVVIIHDETVAALNRQFRGVDAPTDVLTFLAETPPVTIPDAPPYLGDLVIAYPYAAAQAEREGHDLHDSLALLVVHGTLHLLGYDHDTAENRAVMWQAQDAVLCQLGISPAIVPDLEG